MGNLQSVYKKFRQCNIAARISSDLAEIGTAKKLVLPGVGHFSTGVKNLKKLGLWDVINYRVLKCKIPTLGICLGMQLMANNSEEGDAQGFGWFNADIVRFDVIDKLRFKIPHVGWNTINVKKQCELTLGNDKTSLFYFVHSYHIVCKNKNDIWLTSNYDYEFVSGIQKDNIYGVQFHPEKSHDNANQFLIDFSRL